MSKLLKFTSLITGVFAATVNQASADVDKIDSKEGGFGLDKVIVNSLNNHLPLYIAAHRSHSSHGSHRSSSGGSYRAPAPSAPSYTPPKKSYSDPLGQPSKPSYSMPNGKSASFTNAMNDKDKRKILIARVQLQMRLLGFYQGSLDGVMGAKTRSAINAFRDNQGLKKSEKLDLETLNSLGVQIP